MTRYLIGGFGPDMGGTASGMSWGLSHADGRFECGGLAIAIESPSWLTLDGTTAYSTLEGAGEVAEFTLSGAAPVLVERRSSGGGSPCHIALDGNAVIVANYADGAVAVLRRGAAPQVLAGSGSGPLPAQRGPHAHHVLVHEGRVLTLDLGADLLHVHGWDGDQLVRIDSVPLPAGTGPRDLLALPDGRIALLGEWSCEVMLLEPMGNTLEVVQIEAVPGANPGVDQAAGLALSADGRYLVAGTRGSNRIATLALGDAVAPVGWAPSGGDWPRHLVVDGEFVHVANQRSNSVATLHLDAHGILTPVGEPVAVPSPTCLAEVKTAANF